VGIETAEGEGLSPIDVFFFSMSPPQVCPTLRDLLFVWHVLPFSNFVYWADPAHIAGEEEGYGDEF
jgi:hypothetical protein